MVLTRYSISTYGIENKKYIFRLKCIEGNVIQENRTEINNFQKRNGTKRQKITFNSAPVQNYRTMFF
jgi:hypothetical protein